LQSSRNWGNFCKITLYKTRGEKISRQSTNISIIAKSPRGQWKRYYFAYERQICCVSSPLVSRDLFPFLFLSCYTHPSWSTLLCNRLFLQAFNLSVCCEILQINFDSLPDVRFSWNFAYINVKPTILCLNDACLKKIFFFNFTCITRTFPGGCYRFCYKKSQVVLPRCRYNCI